ncbi:glutaredoxin family protein [Solibacillus sp. NPDC093137]|uniref:glutaredoxin family protein n=1 Tax=Solibacillus sp. NPDC093137 TaxID=3390678 RepID=UPI003D07FD1D
MEIIVYSSKSCGHCSNQKDFLNKNGIAFEERDVNNNEQYFKEFKALGGVGVPLTLLKESGETKAVISGFDKQKLSEILIPQ